MKISKISKNVTLLGLIVLMSNIPNILMAEHLINQSEMISSSDVLAQVTRDESEKEVRDYLQKSVVQSELLKQGVYIVEKSRSMRTRQKLGKY